MHAARRWGVIWPAAMAGLVGGAAAGFLASPDVIAVPGLLALSGMALGLLLGLLAAWRRSSECAAAPAITVDRHVAEKPPPWPLAPPPPGGDPAPGWYPDPRHSRARRYWDGDGLDRASVARPATATGRTRSRSCSVTAGTRQAGRLATLRPADTGLGTCGARVTGAWSRFAGPPRQTAAAADTGAATHDAAKRTLETSLHPVVMPRRVARHGGALRCI